MWIDFRHVRDALSKEIGTSYMNVPYNPTSLQPILNTIYKIKLQSVSEAWISIHLQSEDLETLFHRLITSTGHIKLHFGW